MPRFLSSSFFDLPLVCLTGEGMYKILESRCYLCSFPSRGICRILENEDREEKKL